MRGYDSTEIRDQVRQSEAIDAAIETGSLIKAATAFQKSPMPSDCTAYFAVLPDDRDEDGDVVGAGI